jgi:predicted permease
MENKVAEFFRRLSALLRRERFESDLDEEMRLHRELREREEIERGLSPQEAHYAAQRRFGNELVLREESRDMWGWSSVEQLVQDVRYGLRQLRLSPAFAGVAVLSLALGVGANTAIFQLLDAVRLRSLPVPNPHELAEVRIVGGNHGMGLNSGAYGQLTRPVWQEIREHHEPFSGVFAWSTEDVRVVQGSDLRHAHGLYVSGEFFRVLGIQPWRGRLILPEDEGAACPSTKAVVSYSYWQGQMGARDIGTGSTLMINDTLMEVIGVTPPGFFGLAVGDSFDVAVPFCQPKEVRRDVFDVTVMGRLWPGWTQKRASAWLDAISPGIFEATALTGYSTDIIEMYKRFRLGAYAVSGGVSWLRMQYDRSLQLLLAITGLVLLIACANLANLMLARASAREHEVALRLALGASRSRLLRQLLTESALLATMGTALGVSLAQLLSRILLWSLSTESGSIHLEVGTDWRVLLFAAGLAGLTCAFFGAIPALRATKTEPVAAMKAGSRGLTGGRERFSMQRLMMVTQIAVSLVLLVGAFLFVRSFRNLMTFNPGMREDGIIVAFIRYERSHVAPGHYEEFQRQLLDDVRSVPGVHSAATTTFAPLLGGSWSHGVRVGSVDWWSRFAAVSSGYFQTMGIPLLRGRDFNQHDTATSPRVAVVNPTFVRQCMGGADPIGKTLRTQPEPNYPSAAYEIVGVIPDTQYNDLRSETPPMAFVPASQYPTPEAWPWCYLMIHSSVRPAVLMPEVKRQLAEKHPELVMEFGDFQARIRDGLVRERLMAMLSGFFGFLAALLTMVGLYGVISYIVARRRNEIGIRMALGAQRGQVVRMVLREAGRLLIIGITTGTALSLAAGQGAGALLFGLKPYDPLTIIVASALLAAIAAFASFLPARRASKVDPMVALRYE